MEKREKTSAFAIYGIGITWIIGGFFLNYYRITALIVAAIASIVVYVLLSFILPKEVVMVEKDPFKKTQDERINEVIDQANKYVREIQKLNAKIPGERLSERISKIEELMRKIFDYVITNPSHLSDIRRLSNYYLPTTIKLLESYTELQKQSGSEGENITQTMQKIEGAMDTMCKALEKQLDTLFADKAMDVSADITVLESMMKQEGLIEKKDFEINEKEGNTK